MNIEERLHELRELAKKFAKSEANRVYLEEFKKNIVWQASWETNRGCPYRCTFCVWGAEYYNKIRKFSFEDRLLAEIDWFSKNKIGLVFGCDANFGVFK